MASKLLPALLLAAACGSRQPTPATPSPATPAAAPGDALPTEPAEAQPILDDLNRWCAGQGDECDVAERRDAYPGRVASGETNGWISAHREQLAALGVTVVWDVGRRRFVSQVEHDLGLMIGGQFAPDHLGPERYQEILDRGGTRPELYLGVLVERVVGAAPDAGWLSSMHVPYLVELLGERAPETARIAARRLLPLHEAALRASTPAPADDEHRAARLRERVEHLRRLAAD